MKDMRIYNFFAVLLLSAGLLVSCSKSEGIEEPAVPQEPETPTAKLPNITFGKPGTKAMINDADLKTNGSKIHVYDLLTGYTGATFEGWDPTSPYIDEEIIYDGNVVWKYASNGIYPWTATGTHEFFGYLTYDKKSDLNVTSLVTPTLSGKTLTVPSITFTPSSTQFDFLYSDLVSRDASRKDYSVVPLTFKHLFTALSVEVESKTDVKVRLNSITFEGLKNKNSATIAYASPSSEVTLGTSSADGSFFPAMASPVELDEDEIYDPLAKVENPTQRTYFMLWPQTIDDVAPTNVETDAERIAKGYTHKSTDSMIVVSYDLLVAGSWEEHSTRMKLPKMAWEAGKKIHFTIQFSDKLIQLTTKVLPWDYNEYDVDYSEGSVVVPQGLSFDASTCSITGKTVTVLSGKNPVGAFRIVAPVGGTWMMGITGDTEYFTITPTSGTIDPHGAASGWVSFTVTPNLSLARPADKKIKLRFTVTANGRDIDAQSEINRDDWTILLPKN